MSSPPQPSSKGGGRGSRKRPNADPVEGPRTDNELQIEEADPTMIVMRYRRTPQNPAGDVLQLKCPAEEYLVQAREIMASAAPHIQLPNPAIYDRLQSVERQRAIREEWRTIFTFYVQHNYYPAQVMQAGGANSQGSSSSTGSASSSPSSSPSDSPPSQVASQAYRIDNALSSSSSSSSSTSSTSSTASRMCISTSNPPSSQPPSSQPMASQPIEMVPSNPMSSTSSSPTMEDPSQELTVASSALLTSHRRSALVVPPNLSVDFRSDAGSLLFLKRFRLNSSHSTPRSPRPQLEKDKQYGDFLIIGQGHAKHVNTQEIFQCTVLIDDEYEKLRKLQDRLDNADIWYKENDREELTNMLLDPRNVCVKTGREQYTYFTPQHTGSLHSTAQKAGIYGEDATQSIFNTLVRLTAFAHTLGIILRDLTLRKFVFTDNKKTQLQLAIFTDVIVLDSPDSPDEQNDKFGCPAYVSPEILVCGDAPFEGKKADIWSLGVLLFVLLTGRYPFYDTTPRGLFQKIKRCKVEIPATSRLSANTRALIYGLLRRFPQERPTAELLRGLPWVNGHATLSGLVKQMASPTMKTYEEDDLCPEFEEFLRPPLQNTRASVAVETDRPRIMVIPAVRTAV